MRLKKSNLLIMLVLFLTFVFVFKVSAQFEEFIDPQIPDSWYESPQPASEVGITEFSQSPMLDEKVEEGELPPVEERLPDDPPVVEPLEGVGKYGGTANVFGTELTFGSDARYLELGGAAGRATPDGSDVVPFMVKDWEYSEDATEFTIHLREGLKYSDGSECTADDYVFWWEHEAQNKDIQPVPPEEWKPVPLIDVVKEDEYAVTFKYGSPNPNNHRFNGQMGTFGSWSLRPADFLKQIHPDYIGMEEAEELADSVDLDRWEEYFARVRDDSINHPEYEMIAPTLRAYIPVKRTETMLLLERNPYYPFVDTEGNQLPYVDEIKYNLTNDKNAAEVKAITGESSIATEQVLSVENIPSYKENEEQGDYRTLIFNLSRASDPYYFFNLCHEEENFAEVVGDKRFRQAVSLAINREDINNKVFYSEGVPTQATVPATSEYWKQEYAEAYAEYDPD
ncbi:MAG: ABC transporter substrate-binding protein, partial [Halanaerobiales bacterium]